MMIMKTPIRHELSAKSSYKHWTPVTLRYGDTDRLGHINNAVFVSLLESGRVAVLFDEKGVGPITGTTFVIANLNLNFMVEMHYPGTVEIGTELLSFGRSSVKIQQAIFKDGICCATAESTIVLVDETTRKPLPIPDALRAMIKKTALSANFG